jgi:GNAT superfamily N-acetyltransferase
VKSDFHIHAIGLPQRGPLIEMYERFDPLGGALGLPPRTAEARRVWIGSALRHPMNVAAFSQTAEIIGHCFLVVDQPGSAEMAVFVHHAYRRRGVGAALVQAALEWGGTVGLRRGWAVTASENEPALLLLTSCGFRVTQSDHFVTEMEIDLPVPWATRETVQPLRDLSRSCV